MARPKTNHEEKKAQILSAAMKTFAQHGYEGTTNKLIAAEVRHDTGQSFSPALIYHYFPEGKLQLLETVVHSYQPLQNLGRVLQQETAAPPDIFLPRAARAYIQIFKEPGMARMARIFFIEGPRHPELAQHIFGRIMPIILLPLANYLQRQADQGHIRPINPFAAIFQFFGPLLIRAFATENLRQMEQLPFPLPDDDEMIASHVQTFLHGITLDTSAQQQAEGGS
jgi:AcrR family transcriptional regulator